MGRDGANGVLSYRTTLNSRDAVDDLREKDEMLKACHKRCAERTLKVLEKNGGIFIKLGQHLVRQSRAEQSQPILLNTQLTGIYRAP